MQIKTTMKYHITTVRLAITKKSKNSKCWRQCGVKGTLIHYWKGCKLVQPPCRTVWRFFKFQKQSYYTICNPTPGYPSGENHNFKICLKIFSAVLFIRTPMFSAVLFIITRKQPKCPSTNEWMKKMWYIFMIEYYSAIKKN